MSRLRAWWRWTLGVRCPRCSGAGSYIGHSPTASLSTFRHAVTLTCPRCRGRGRVDPTA